MSPLRILFIGATGFVGGSTLARLLEHPQRRTFDITVLLRSTSKDKAKGFEELGIKVAFGSLEDLDILESLASEADITFQSAHSDVVPATQALLRGMKTYFENAKKAPIYIHTSGTGILLDNAEGRFATEDITSDLNTSKTESLPVQAPHRAVDVLIVEANKQGYLKGYIVAPGVVWGIADNILVQKGLQKPFSTLSPVHISLSVKRGAPLVFGEGKNLWSNVNFEEACDFYMILFDAIISGKNPAQDYYFLEHEEFKIHDLCTAVGDALLKYKKVPSAALVPLTEEEKDVYPMRLLGGNSRARGDRARLLGWEPVKGTAGHYASMEPEVAFWIKRQVTPV